MPPNTQNDDFPIKMASIEQLLQTLQLAHRRSSVRFAPTTLTDSPTLFAPEPYRLGSGYTAGWTDLPLVQVTAADIQSAVFAFNQGK